MNSNEPEQSSLREWLTRQLSLTQAIRTKRARGSLAEFIGYTMPSFDAGWFHRVLCDELDSFLDDVVNKRGPRLILCCPPQHGKSEVVSRRFPAYALGRYPHLRIIACSYAASLAFDLSRDLQRVLDGEPYHKVFPGTVIPGTFGVRGSATRRLENFGIVGHQGGYRCAGADGSLTGKSCEILVIDDPHKNAQEVHSPVIREMLYRNFQTSLRTRVQEGGGIVVVGTRWHKDDLIGRLLENEPDIWKVLNFPAIAVEDEEFRKEGEPLSVERYSLATLEELKASLGDYLWNGLCQQQPTCETGSLLKRWKWRYWQYAGMNLSAVQTRDDAGKPVEIAVEELPGQFDRHFQSWDLSFTGSATSDYVCGLDIRTSGPKRYITDAVHERLDFTATIRAIEDFRARHPSCSASFIEKTANGAASIDLLQQRLAGVNAVTATKSKWDRATASSDSLNAGDWYLPHPSLAAWVGEFLLECSGFPMHRHDDYVDAWSQAAGELNSGVDYSMFTSAVNVFAGLGRPFRHSPWEW